MIPLIGLEHPGHLPDLSKVSTFRGLCEQYDIRPISTSQ